MPVKSQAQWKWLAVHRPDLLHKWQHESPVNYRQLAIRKKAKKKHGHQA